MLYLSRVILPSKSILIGFSEIELFFDLMKIPPYKIVKLATYIL